jgi:hypothetical protein
MQALVNAALGIAEGCRMSGRRGDFIAVDFPTVRKMIQAADDYRRAAEREVQP